MVKQGITHVVVETTAHGLDQFRFWGCHFKVGVLTNIAHEHLDDFINIKQYTEAKSKLFFQSDIAVLNNDDQSFNFLKKTIPSQVVTYSIKNKSDFQAKNINITPVKMSFNVNQLELVTNTPYQYQVYNILAALAVIVSLKIDTKFLLNTIKKFPDTKGRREIVKNNLKIKTIIDFAHTPQALLATLESLRNITKGKLIVIFGATGGRDQTKRPLMGEVASKNSDIAIITADDTRNESIDIINQQIISGIKPSSKFEYYNIPNRQDAFNLAVKLASPGDTIVACGKGHETTILHGTTEYPWSEAEAFRSAFRLKSTHV
jgi:UDP-N-acetylmuramoyl-L-alanyl-D-glutamate--2,6-diaminopimelate ligase